MTKGHSLRTHAILSASGSKKWMNCTPSANLEDLFPEKSSKFAEEGTLAHELSELKLLKLLGRITDKKFKSELNKIEKNPLYSKDMDKYTEEYVNIVLETNFSLPEGSQLMLEMELDYSYYVKDGFGIMDAAHISPKKIIVQDLKYGEGVRVEAYQNSQLMIYGLSVLRAYSLIYPDVETVTMEIIQPRMGNYSTFTMTVEELEHWGETTLRDIAKKAAEGSGEQMVGDWCQFCKVKPICAKQKQIMEDFVNTSHLQHHTMLSDETILELYRIAGIVESYAKSLQEFVTSEAIKGKKWPGYKLIEGIGRRVWTDETKAENILRDMEFDSKQYLTLAGFGKVEALVGEKNFSTIFAGTFGVSSTSKKLVPSSDKRPGISGADSAKDDFKDD